MDLPTGAVTRSVTRARGDRGELWLLGVAQESGHEVAMLLGAVPVERSTHTELLVEFAGADHRHRRRDPVVDRRQRPGVVAAARSPGEADPPGIDVRT